MENDNILETDYVQELLDLIRGNESDEVKTEQLSNYHDNDIASALDQLTDEERDELYQMLGAERMSAILPYTDDAGSYIEDMELEDAADIIENMDADDAVDVLEDVDEEVREQLIDLLEQESKEDIQLIRSYEDDEIGSKMTTNYIEISKDLSIKQAMRELIAQAEDNDNITTIYVKDTDGCFYGAINLKDLICARNYVELETLISLSYPFVRDHESITDCIERLKDYAEDSIPVLDDNNCILGVITSQDIVEVVDDEMSEDYVKLAGLTEEEELEESLFVSIKKRLPWLIALLALATCVSTVTGLFEGVIAHLAVIVSFQSLILGMSGNVGTQSLAVTIRFLMDENLSESDKFKHVFKEIRVGFCNGLLLGLLALGFIGCYIYIFKEKTLEFSFAVSACVGAALWLAMTISSFVGAIVPMIFHKLKVDPAVASGPLITTVNDLVAVVTYYGLAWTFLINVLNL